MIKIGSIKVIYLGNNSNIIKAEIFDTFEEAQPAINRAKDYIVTKLIEQKDNEYQWLILPYGRYKELQSAIQVLNTTK